MRTYGAEFDPCNNASVTLTTAVRRGSFGARRITSYDDHGPGQPYRTVENIRYSASTQGTGRRSSVRKRPSAARIGPARSSSRRAVSLWCRACPAVSKYEVTRGGSDQQAGGGGSEQAAPGGTTDPDRSGGGVRGAVQSRSD